MPSSRTLSARELLTPAEAASILGSDVDTVRGWIRSGELMASDLRSRGAKKARYRIRRSDLDEFVERRQVHPRPQQQQSRRRRAPAGDVIQFF